MIGGEVIQFPECFSKGDGICQRDGRLIVGKGLIRLTQSQVRQATVEVETRFWLALNGDGVVFNSSGIIAEGKGKLAQASISIGMVGG